MAAAAPPSASAPVAPVARVGCVGGLVAASRAAADTAAACAAASCAAAATRALDARKIWSTRTTFHSSTAVEKVYVASTIELRLSASSR